MAEAKTDFILPRDIPENARVCIYGAGQGGSDAFELINKYRPDVTVVAFADTYRSGEKLGRPVFAPDELDKHQKDFELIIICSLHYKAIAAALNSKGFDNFAALSSFQFLDYLFSPEDLKRSEPEVRYILDHLDSDEDRELFRFLIKARSMDSRVSHAGSSDLSNPIMLINDPEALKDRFPRNTGNCYFDFVNPEHVSTVFQGGVFNGKELDFLRSHFSSLSRIYGYDPNGDSRIPPERRKVLSEDGRFTIVQAALWNKEGHVQVNGGDSGLHVIPPDSDSSKHQGKMIESRRLDSDIERFGLEKIDLLLCDIENSEIPMLEGGLDTIEAHRPQLAISFYHSKQQFLEIPLLLMSRLDNYVFKIGHYSHTTNESVFYAIPRECFSGFISYDGVKK